MKTTVEMSESLLTELKVIAAREHRRLRDVMEEIVTLGLHARRKARERDPEAEAEADSWLESWQSLGRQIEDASIDPRSCVEIVLSERR